MIDYCVATQEEDETAEQAYLCWVCIANEREERIKSKKNQNMSLGGKNC